jgi:hypothetical protein
VTTVQQIWFLTIMQTGLLKKNTVPIKNDGGIKDELKDTKNVDRKHKYLFDGQHVNLVLKKQTCALHKE